MKIPTFLGLFILFLISVGLIFGTLFIQKNIPKPKTTLAPVNLEQNNISHDQVTITWETLSPDITELLVSTNPNMSPIFEHLRDDRDNATSASRLTHISTINNLLPNTDYFIKTKIKGLLYPITDTRIKTATNTAFLTNYNPIVGSVVDQNLQSVNDALVFLLVEDANPLSTGVGQNGNFILPLNLLANKNSPDQPTNPESLANAVLLIQKGDQKSEVTIDINNIPQPLPPIVLGQNFDFRHQASPSAILQN